MACESWKYMSFSRGRFLSLLLPSSSCENINVCAKSLPGLHMPKMMIIYRRELIHSKLKRSERAKIFTLPPVEFLARWFITVSQNNGTSEASSNFKNFVSLLPHPFCKTAKCGIFNKAIRQGFWRNGLFLFCEQSELGVRFAKCFGFPIPGFCGTS